MLAVTGHNTPFNAHLTSATLRSDNYRALAKSSAGIGIPQLQEVMNTPLCKSVFFCDQSAPFMVGRAGNFRVGRFLVAVMPTCSTCHPIEIGISCVAGKSLYKETIMSNLTPKIRLVGGTPVTSSRDIAELFGRRHDDVLRKIQNLDCSPEFNARNFTVVEYIDSKGETRNEYQITRDGFTFLAMGFTGKRAAQFKEAYIKRFNELEQQSHTTTAHSLEDAEKYQLLNTMIQSMGFSSAPVVVPSMDMIDLIRSVRSYQMQIARLTEPKGVDDTIERVKQLTQRSFLDGGAV